ncbi:hypothetical protein, partial [Mesorhizobium sp. M1C.F.Ca.ET.144.01.1.1]|uniref:hypothetical protein n=1 Tax=Mesorhizobium sp. M1C.F.Ca.ET.144.01.1.1 TaxID=2563921 RepID=UPI001AED729B
IREEVVTKRGMTQLRISAMQVPVVIEELIVVEVMEKLFYKVRAIHVARRGNVAAQEDDRLPGY